MKTILFVCLCFSLASCARYSYETLPAERLHFGTKGGLHGELRAYILLLENRQLLFKDPLEDDLEKIGRVDASLMAEIERTLPQLAFEPSALGNYNAVLIHYTAEGMRDLQWSSPKGAPDEATQALFEALMAEVRRLRKTKKVSSN